MWDIALMMLPVLVLFYFLMIRPGRRQEAERKKLIDTLKKDDEVLTYAGVFGKIVSIHETEDEAVIKLEDNTRVKVLKSSILRNISGEKALKEEQAKK
jgi:preprotein translocase subunit YajC